MRLTIAEDNKNKYNFYFEFPFDYEIISFCRTLKDKYSYNEFGFDPKLKRWGFNNALIAIDIYNQYKGISIDDEIVSAVKEEKAKEVKDKIVIEKLEDIKSRDTSDLIIEGLKLDLYGFQKNTVEFIDMAKGRCIVGSDMGSGKTCTSLAYCVYKKLKKMLIVCPASVKGGWEDEIEKWTDYSSYVTGGDGKDMTALMSEVNVTIINYDILKKFEKELCAIDWDIAILDESHNLKNPQAKRTKIAMRILKKIDKIVLMSGTAIMNRPIEIFTSLKILDSKTWGNYYKFATRYAGGRQTSFGFKADGATNIKELKERMSRFYIRYTKDEVLKELAEKKFEAVDVAVSKKDFADYRLIETDFKKYLKSVKGLSTHETIKALFAEKLVKLNELRQSASNLKIEATIKVAEDLISDGHKVLIFSVYNRPLEIMEEHFGERASVISGKIQTNKRKDIINEFQSNPNKSVFLGGMLSGGVGITLTAADAVILCDFAWRPGDAEQAINRLHRPSQKAKTVYIYQMQVPGTIDERMRDLLLKKKEVVDSLLERNDTDDVGGKSIITGLLNQYS